MYHHIALCFSSCIYNSSNIYYNTDVRTGTVDNMIDMNIIPRRPSKINNYSCVPIIYQIGKYHYTQSPKANYIASFITIIIFIYCHAYDNNENDIGCGLSRLVCLRKKKKTKLFHSLDHFPTISAHSICI